MSVESPAGMLIEAVEVFLRRYVVLTDAQVGAEALWVAHSHAIEGAHASPYLAISSAEKRSGKTQNLEALQFVVARPWFTGRCSTAALMRKIDAECPTLLLDESDAAFSSGEDYAEALRGTLNNGYRRGGKQTVCVGKGADFVVKDFDVFCPKAIAGIGRLPDTVRDRSIPIRLQRRTSAEAIQRFRVREVKRQGELLASALAQWADEQQGLIEELSTAEPDIPTELHDRAADCWEPLLAIADHAGGQWPERARAIAVELSAGDGPEEDSLGVRLLADCRRAFADHDRLPTRDLRRALIEMDEAPWGDLRGKEMTARRMGDLLRAYGVRSRDYRFTDGILKGYARESFADAWRRYLPLEGVAKRNMGNNGSSKPESAHSEPQQLDVCCALENAENPHGQAIVADVAVQAPDTGAIAALGLEVCDD